MKKLTIFLLTAIILSNCTSTSPASEEATASLICGAVNPSELPWLKDMIEESVDKTCTIYEVYSAVHNGKEVFLIRVTGPLCDTCAGEAVYNCEGKSVYFCNPEEDKLLTGKKLVWKR